MRDPAEAPTSGIMLMLGGKITNIAAPTVEGQAETEADVQLFVDNLLVGQAGAGSAWQIPIPPRLMAFMMCLPPPRTWRATSANPL